MYIRDIAYVRREPRAAFGASLSTAQLGGKSPRSQIFGCQPCAFSDTGKHFGTNGLAIMEREDEIRPSGTRESLV
jgi:hypothetical protein